MHPNTNTCINTHESLDHNMMVDFHSILYRTDATQNDTQSNILSIQHGVAILTTPIIFPDACKHYVIFFFVPLTVEQNLGILYCSKCFALQCVHNFDEREPGFTHTYIQKHKRTVTRMTSLGSRLSMTSFTRSPSGDTQNRTSSMEQAACNTPPPGLLLEKHTWRVWPPEFSIRSLLSTTRGHNKRGFPDHASRVGRSLRSSTFMDKWSKTAYSG